ncbi:DNA polymerase III subunit beta [Viridibacillus arvi]|uniref:DNA polymerase III subunit beta n=1 Tax=Viridibacillus arvi TaxID=263475 RepID=UPI0034CE2C5D
MKIEINRETLVKATQDVLKAISSKTTMPVLTGIKIEASTDGLTLKGSDGDMSIVTFVPLEEDERHFVTVERTGSVVIQAKLFADIIKKLPNKEVSLELNDKYVTKVQSGSAEFSIIGFNPEEYPKFPVVEDEHSIKITNKALKEAIQATIFATSDSGSRPVLTGVNWQLAEGLLCIATDSHRLSNKKVSVETSATELNAVIPKKSLGEISKLLDDSEDIVTILFTGNQVLFKLKNTLIYSRLLEGNYPDTSRLIPSEASTTVQLNKRELLNSIERASLLAIDTNNNHVIKFATKSNGAVQISSRSQELGHVEEEVQASSIEGEELTLSFSAKYMKEALKALDGEEITVYFTGAMRPFVIKPIDDNASLQLILPVRTY